MNITYKSIKDLPNEQLYKLFISVGWADESTTTQAMIDNFNKPFINSTIVISAWDNDLLVGCVRVFSDKMFRSVIYDLAVLPEYQGKGIGTQAIREIIKNDLPYMYTNKILLRVRSENERAIKCYNKVGFIETQRYEKDGLNVIEMMYEV